MEQGGDGFWKGYRRKRTEVSIVLETKDPRSRGPKEELGRETLSSSTVRVKTREELSPPGVIRKGSGSGVEETPRRGPERLIRELKSETVVTHGEQCQD